MTTTVKQDQDFAQDMLSGVLQEAINYIAANLENEDEKDFVSKNYSTLLDLAIDWIGEELNPEDVFNDEELQKWAKDNGFVEQE